MKLTQSQYEETLRDPIAFYEHILGNPIKLSQAQLVVLRSFLKYPETLVICGSKSGKSMISSIATLWMTYRMLETDPHRKYSLPPNSNLYAMVIAPKEDLAINITLKYIQGFAGRNE